MYESLILKGAILSAVSIAIGGLIIAAMIMGYECEYINIILPLVAVFIVLGIAVMMYGTSMFEKEPAE